MRTTMRSKSLRGVLFTFLLAAWSVLDVHAVDYKLAMSEEKDVCQLMLAFSNDKFPNRGLSSFMKLEHLPPLKAPEFEMVSWGATAVNSSFRGVDSTVVDMNNDGELDWVLKTQWSLSGQLSDRLDIYVNRREPLNITGGLDYEVLDRADRHLNLIGEDYPLKKIPPYTWKDGTRTEYSIGGVFKLIPFRFRNVTYILMATPGALPEMLPGKRKFVVVTKYVSTFELHDVCYIEEMRSKKK